MDNGDDRRVIELKKRKTKGGGEDFMKQQTQMVTVGIIVIVVLFLLRQAVVIVPAGHVGVQELFGKVSDEALTANIHLINPLKKVQPMSIRTKEINEPASVPSKEGLTVNLDISLLYSLVPGEASKVYRTIGMDFERVVVVPQLRSVVRGVTAGFEAKALYTSAREQIAEEMYRQLAPNLETRGIKVEALLLRSVGLPQILSTAIEKKLEAEQQAEQMKFVLQREQQEAERKKVEAFGIAEFQKIISMGLTSNLLRWKGIEATLKLSESSNSKVVVIGSGDQGLPIILGGDKD